MLEAIINVILGSADLQNKLNYDVDANLFFREDPVYFLREMCVEIEQNSLMEICKLGLISQTETCVDIWYVSIEGSKDKELQIKHLILFQIEVFFC